jgi:hypothetical protein
LGEVLPLLLQLQTRLLQAGIALRVGVLSSRGLAFPLRGQLRSLLLQSSVARLTLVFSFGLATYTRLYG